MLRLAIHQCARGNLNAPALPWDNGVTTKNTVRELGRAWFEKSMRLPQEPVDLRKYHDSVIEALGNPSVLLYVDTNVLMWLLEAGLSVRQEFLNWSNTKVTNRVFVPTWSAHELYIHIKKETVLKRMLGRQKIYEGTLRQAFLDLALTADDVSCEGTPFNDRAHLLQHFQAQLSKLREDFAKTLDAKKIKKQYQRALGDIIAFVNGHGTDVDSSPLLLAVSESERVRFSGRVPPGFRDEGKSENNIGDLVFWEEVLVHVKSRHCTSAIILTNDNKSDWHFKPQQLYSYDGARKAIQQTAGFEAQLPHPFLEHEAFCRIGLQDLFILDVSMLTVVLDRSHPDLVGSLLGATHPENGVNWRLIAPDGIDEREVHETTTIATFSNVGQAGGFSETRPLTLEELRDSPIPASVSDALAALDGDVEARTNAANAILTSEFLSRCTQRELALVGRRLFRAASNKGFPLDVRLAEVFQIESLGDAVHNVLGLGMFVELYFDGGMEIRPQPLSGPFQVLFDLQYDDRFGPALEQLSVLLADYSQIFLTVPKAKPDAIELQIQLVRPPEKGLKHVESVICQGKELLGETTPEASASLTRLLGGASASIDQLIRAISKRFTVPFRQLTTDKQRDSLIAWPPERGMRPFRVDLGGVCDELSIPPGEAE